MALVDTLVSMIPIVLLCFSIIMNMGYWGFEKKFPSFKYLRASSRKGKQYAWMHDPSGSVTGVIMEVIPGSNQLDLEKYNKGSFGIKFKPKDMNQAEYIDNRQAVFHYVGVFPHNVTVKGVAALSRVRRLLEARGMITTPEKLTTLMYRDLTLTPVEVRKTMVPGSQARIDDKEMGKLADVQKQLKNTKTSSKGSFVFADANDFLYGVGMSAAGSLREWKSYITVVARGETQTKSFLQMETGQIGKLLIFLAIAYIIYKAGTMGSIMGSVKI